MLGASRSAGTAQHDCVEGLRESPFVVQVRAADGERQRHTATIGQYMAFGAALGPIGGIGAREVPPFGAFTMAPSCEHQSSPAPLSRSYSRSSFTQVSRKIPSSTHSVNRRCTVEPFGSAFQGQPVRRRNTTCAKTARAGRGGRPPRGFAHAGGIIGSTSAHKSSGTSSLGNRVFGTPLYDHGGSR